MTTTGVSSQVLARISSVISIITIIVLISADLHPLGNSKTSTLSIITRANAAFIPRYLHVQTSKLPFAEPSIVFFKRKSITSYNAQSNKSSLSLSSTSSSSSSSSPRIIPEVSNLDETSNSSQEVGPNGNKRPDSDDRPQKRSQSSASYTSRHVLYSPEDESISSEFSTSKETWAGRKLRVSTRTTRSSEQPEHLSADLACCATNSSSCIAKRPAVFGLRCDNGEMVDGELLIKANEPAQIILIGQNLELNFSLALTPTIGNPGEDCTHLDRVKSIPVLTYLTTTSAQVTFNVPWPGSKMPYYMCIRELTDGPTQNSTPWFHQGSHNLVRLYVHEEWLNLYMKMFVIACLLMLSGLFSGLNLGLMSLDKNELAVIISCGSEKEKRYARAIEPVRRRGNYLLCSILFSNVLVNSTIAVLLEDLTSGSVAVMTSTIFIVMFGEILPQAFCSRHGLAVGAKTVAITYLCMFLTCPLSYPVSACLDWALGEEISHAYDRERLMEFIRITSDYNNLETEEVNIISGALKLKRVHLVEVMTRIEDAFMLDVNSCLDFDTIKAIVERGYSRVPVHEANNKGHIIALLLTKDLALLDPDDKTPVQTLISFYDHPVMFMFEDTTLHEALTEFKTGKSHMAFVRRVLDDGDRDPLYEVTGIATFEDVIEEILQMEINDETDTLTDNIRKRRRKEAQVRNDFLQFTKHHASTGDWAHVASVTPQLCLAAYQFLSTNVEPFSKQFISDLVLKRLLAEKIYHKIRLDGLNQAPAPTPGGGQEGPQERTILFRAGQPVDYFIMILEGRVSVVCGAERLTYEAGPFSHFGKGALSGTWRHYDLNSNKNSTTSSSRNQLQLDLAPNSPTSEANNNTNPGPLNKRLPSTQGLPTKSPSANQFSSSSSISMTKPRLEADSTAHWQPTDADSTTKQQHQWDQHNSQEPANQSLGQSAQSVSSSFTEATGERTIGPLAMVSYEAAATTRELSLQAAYPNQFVPDFTVQVISNASYLKISREQYLSALKATLQSNNNLEQQPQLQSTAQRLSRDSHSYPNSHIHAQSSSSPKQRIIMIQSSNQGDDIELAQVKKKLDDGSSLMMNSPDQHACLHNKITSTNTIIQGHSRHEGEQQEHEDKRSKFMIDNGNQTTTTNKFMNTTTTTTTKDVDDSSSSTNIYSVVKRRPAD